MPVIDALSNEYGDRVSFVAPAWNSTFEATRAAAENLMPSGNILWGLDEDKAVFEAYGVPYQPVTVLIAADGTIFDAWPGVRGETELRDALDRLVSATA